MTEPSTKMVVAVEFDAGTGDPQQELGDVLESLRIELAHKPGVKIHGAIRESAMQIIDILEKS